MKSHQSILIFLILSSFIHCQSTSDQIKKAFTTVDNSLKASNKLLEDSVEITYTFINSNRLRNEQIALKADTIYLANKFTANYIDSLNEIMQTLDTTGTNIQLATKLFVSSENEKKLRALLLNIYSKTESYTNNIPKLKEIEITFNSFNELKSNVNWTKQYFENTPTVGAITMLNKFKSDCANATSFTLKELKIQMAE